MTTPSSPSSLPEHKKRPSLIIAVVVLALLMVGGWFGFKHYQLQGARRDAQFFQSELQRQNITARFDTERSGDTLVWKDVTLDLPVKAGDDTPTKMLIESVAFTGGDRIVFEKLAVPLSSDNPDAGRVGLREMTITGHGYTDGVLTDYTLEGKGLLAEGSRIEALRGQLLGVLPLALAKAPKELRSLPQDVLTALDNLTLNGKAQLDTSASTFHSASSVTLPDMFAFDIDIRFDDITAQGVALMSRSKLDRLADQSDARQFFAAVQQLGKGDYTLRFDNNGIIDKALAVAAAMQQTDTDAVRQKLLTDWQQKAEQKLADKPAEVQAFQRSLMTATQRLLTGESDTLVINATPTPALQQYLADAESDLLPKLEAADSEKQRQTLLQNWWRAMPFVTGTQPLTDMLALQVTAQ